MHLKKPQLGNRDNCETILTRIWIKASGNFNFTGLLGLAEVQALLSAILLFLHSFWGNRNGYHRQKINNWKETTSMLAVRMPVYKNNELQIIPTQPKNQRIWFWSDCRGKKKHENEDMLDSSSVEKLKRPLHTGETYSTCIVFLEQIIIFHYGSSPNCSQH